MSIFKTQLKKMKTRILGHEVELKVNNAVYLYLQSLFGLTQGSWSEEYEQENVIGGAKFVVAVLAANGYETTLEEVLENTNFIDIQTFLTDYQLIILSDAEEQAKGDSKKGKAKK